MKRIMCIQPLGLLLNTNAITSFKKKNAIPILEKNLYKVDWVQLSRNPSIFGYDYVAIKKALYKKG